MSCEERIRERTEEPARANLELKEEMELRKSAEKSLRESEERYRRIIQPITDYIYSVRVEEIIP